MDILNTLFHLSKTQNAIVIFIELPEQNSQFNNLLFIQLRSNEIENNFL